MHDFPGDSFSLSGLLLPRAACAYGLQRLGTDQLWSQHHSEFRGIRAVQRTDLFDLFESAAQAGEACLVLHPDAPIAIVPIAYDPVFERFVLIQGVIQP